MAKSSPIEEILRGVRAICFHLPFWVVPLLAAVLAGLIYWLVGKLTAGLFPQDAGVFVSLPIIATLLAFALVFLAGTAGWLERRKRKMILAQTNSLKKLQDLSWREFEQLIGEVYRSRGYRVWEGTGNGPDGGIDLDTTSPSGERVLIQCKHWKAQKIGVTVVREMLGVLTRERADRVVIVGTGSFTKEAMAWAKDQPIDLVDGATLLQQLSAVDLFPTNENRVGDSPYSDKKQCPQCGSTLIVRTAKRGSHSGSQFMGCSSYPKCKYTESLAEGFLEE